MSHIIHARMRTIPSPKKKENMSHNQAKHVGKKKITPPEKITNMPIHTAKVCSSHFMVNQLILAPNGHFCSKHKFWPSSLSNVHNTYYKSAFASHAHIRVTTTVLEKELIQGGSTKRECFHLQYKLYLETKEQDMSIFLPKDIYATLVQCYKNFMVAEILV